MALSESHLMPYKPILLGALYGTVLLVFAALSAGFGHGLYAPLGWIAAPASLFGVAPALLLTVPLWTLVSVLACKATKTNRKFSIVLLCVHYLSAGFMLLRSDGDFGDYGRVAQVSRSIAMLAVSTAVLYGIGQVMLWVQIFRRA